jgi:hypothetical protein
MTIALLSRNLVLFFHEAIEYLFRETRGQNTLRAVPLFVALSLSSLASSRNRVGSNSCGFDQYLRLHRIQTYFDLSKHTASKETREREKKTSGLCIPRVAIHGVRAPEHSAASRYFRAVWKHIITQGHL